MHMLGTSGTVTTLAGVHLNLARYDRRRIDGIWMNDSDVTAVIQRGQSWMPHIPPCLRRWRGRRACSYT